MKEFTIEVTQFVTVRIDEAKLAPLLPEFNDTISDYGLDDDAYAMHAVRIARLAAMGEDFEPGDFVEGYGLVKDAGIDVAVSNYLGTEMRGVA